MIESIIRRSSSCSQIVKGYNVDWYPIIQGYITSQDMIEEYGDLFKTYDDAQDTYNNQVKKGAIALAKDTMSITMGGNLDRAHCIIYEEGFDNIVFYGGKTTISFNSDVTYKHIVFYTDKVTGNASFSWARWIILSKNYYVNEQVGLKGSSIKYIHVENKEVSKSALLFNCSVNQKTISGYNGATMYIPDWYSGKISHMQFNQCTKIRLSKGVTGVGANNIYSWGNKTNETPNITDIYCYWGLGEVMQQNFNRFTHSYKLHIPDLGNEEDNAALVAEYRSKGWNYLSGGGIFNDVEETEPEEMLL